MKFLVILLVALAVCHSAPMDDNEASAKSKRGLHLGIGYHHSPIVTHSYVAPAVVHHAPIIAHAPVISHVPIISHAPLIAHASPLYATHHIIPSYHSFHHYK